jgi:hypothetical protein
MKISLLKQLIKEEIQHVLESNFFTFNPSNTSGGGGKSKRFTPDLIFFYRRDRDALPPYTDETGQQKPHFKLLKSPDGSYKLYISPLLKVALEGIQRGRTPINNKTAALVTLVQEKLPNNVRALLKKYSPKINSSLGMFPVNVLIKHVTPDGDIIFPNPGAKLTWDPEDYEDKVISETNK